MFFISIVFIFNFHTGKMMSSTREKVLKRKLYCYGWNFIATLFVILLTSLVSGFITPTSLPFYQHHRASSRIHHAHNIISIGENSEREEEAGDDSVKKRIVVIGNGMVGQRFIENLIKLDKNGQCLISTFCEEPRAAYNRVKLTSYFDTRDPSSLSMTSEYDAHGKTSWYEEQKVQLLLNDKALHLDTTQKIITGASGRIMPYDVAVLATGSFPFVPPIPGKDRPGIFVYRTIEDLEEIWSYAKDNHVKSAAILGGGLLGLEAAKAVYDIGVEETHIIEFAPILMARQIDAGGHEAMISVIESMGLKVHCNARTAAFIGTDGSHDSYPTSENSCSSSSPVAAVRFSNDGWADLPVQMVVISAGIKPRDEIAKACGIQVGDRGGVIVDDQMRTSNVDIFAIGEVALHKNFIYGLVAPGYDMAKVAAENIAADMGLSSSLTPSNFTGADLSTKLKLLGCDVASFGENQPRPDDPDITELTWKDPFKSVYRKLIFNKAGTRLRGGVLVGDASDFNTLQKLAVSGTEINPQDCAALLPPPSVQKASTGGSEVGDLPSDSNALICSCNDVSRGMISKAVQDLGLDGANLKALKKCTKAGTGCGGCEPLVKSIMAEEIKKLGGKVSNHLCEHFSYSRPELMALIRTEKHPTTVDSFEKIILKHGSGDGCEICKPAVASILASLFNEIILSDGRDALQDTNDRSLANMQRGGTYSVVPRVPGGEITPNQLIALGQTADKFGLYTKITGGQRIDLFGASKHQLPDIWEQLGEAGFESGHAYGKALRTVKSCVGSTWCRYGVQDSVSFAVRVENRYKAVRAPHKMKGGVSGCIRECAEAQGKDFGLIATEKGYNLFVGGNGGAVPVHAQLLASDIDEDTVLKYLDRYLMYYILTADRLERTAVWQKKLPSGKNGGGPIEHLKDVIIDDSLGICQELDKRMQHLVDSYHDEWAEVVKDPLKRAKFNQFANTDKTLEKEELIEFVNIRGQKRPADWPADGQPQTNWRAPDDDVFSRSEKSWVVVGSVHDFSPNVGTAILYGNTQLAVFNNAFRGEWYCTQNMCPHKQAFVLSQGIIGSFGDMPKVACPLHKKNFNLDSGAEVGGGELKIITFPVKINEDSVMVELPSTEEVDAILGTRGLRVLKTECIDISGDAIKVPIKSGRSNQPSSIRMP